MLQRYEIIDNWQLIIDNYFVFLRIDYEQTQDYISIINGFRQCDGTDGRVGYPWCG